MARTGAGTNTNNCIEDKAMQVILLERVQNLGGLGDSVKVKPGLDKSQEVEVVI